MARYARVNAQNAIEEFRVFDAAPDPNPAKGWRWLPAPIVTSPSYDPMTEKRTGPVHTVGANSVTQSWSVVALTAQEISDRKDSAIAGMEGSAIGYAPIYRALFNLNNRVRTLEGQNTMTAAQFKAAIKALL
jgi:hypothetical protein